MTVGKYLQDGVWYPEYPELGAGVAKYRRLAAKAGGVAALTKAERHAYADAIEKAIRAKHRTLHMRPTPKETGGWYSPPSIARLLRYENPLPMAGDPDWGADCGCGNLRYYEKHSCNKWELREKAVYAATMKAKQDAVLEAAE